VPVPKLAMPNAVTAKMVFKSCRELHVGLLDEAKPVMTELLTGCACSRICRRGVSVFLCASLERLFHRAARCTMHSARARGAVLKPVVDSTSRVL